MSTPGTESYSIDNPQPSPDFLKTRNVAGSVIQAQFEELAGRVEPARDYRWIKAELTWPSFDHLTFAYGNQVFSVLVDLLNRGASSISKLARDRCLEACSENDLVPCVFRVDARGFQPVEPGWNLRHLEDFTPVIPAELATEEKIPMSDWERRNFAIQIVRGHLEEQRKATNISYSDVIGIDPQIWFQEPEGSGGWVVVRDYPVLSGDEKRAFIGIEKQHAHLQAFDGYFAGVSFASSEPFVYDLDAKLVPLSKRFDGSAPLYRGDGCHVKFNGLERIHVS